MVRPVHPSEASDAGESSEAASDPTTEIASSSQSSMATAQSESSKRIRAPAKAESAPHKEGDQKGGARAIASSFAFMHACNCGAAQEKYRELLYRQRPTHTIGRRLSILYSARVPTRIPVYMYYYTTSFVA